MKNIINKGTKVIFTIFLLAIILIISFGQNIEYKCKKEFLISNIGIICILVLFYLLCYFGHKFISKKGIIKLNINYDKIIKISTICLFFVQVYISYNILFYTGWDASGVTNVARSMAKGEIENINEIYPLQRFPNNAMIANFYSCILKINSKFGIFTGQYDIMSIVICNCIISSLSCFLIYKILSFYIDKKYAFISYFIGVLSFGISPWMIICYSDALGLILPILIFYLYVKPSKKVYKIIDYILIALLSVIGYSIKPQCIIMLIAIFFIEILNGLLKDRKRLYYTFLYLLGFIVFFILSQKMLRYVYTLQGFKFNKEEEFGIAHYFMMGQNEEACGIFSSSDVQYSMTIPTAFERTKRNIGTGLIRIKDMGAIGYIKFQAKKTLVNFNDGTFAWGVEGDFYHEVYDKTNEVASPFLREIYYTNGNKYPIFSTFLQIIWIAIILLNIFSILYNCVNNKKDIDILMLSIIGITLFEALFEARARYIYTYVPVFCILAGIGLYSLVKYNNKIMIKILEKNKEKTKLLNNK